MSADASRNWFDRGGEAYARFRPVYPDRLAKFLVSASPDKRLALDVGCGSGQLALLLAENFERVVGIDPSADQLAHAAQHERVEYRCAAAERLPLPDGSVSLVAAAQAAHWFDLPAFYEEVRRVCVPGGVLALISYGVPRLETGLNERFIHFYREEIGPFWPPERKLVDEGYAGIGFPFPEFSAPTMSIDLQWSLSELLGYISTWSAVRRAREEGRREILLNFAKEMEKLWGDDDERRSVEWPVNMRIGKLERSSRNTSV